MDNDAQKFYLSSIATGRDGENIQADLLNDQMNHTDIGDSFSDTKIDDSEQSISDSDSDDRALSVSESGSDTSICVDGPKNSEYFSGNSMIRLEGGREHNIVKQKFLCGMKSLEKHTMVVAIHRNSYSSLLDQARLQSFKIFFQAMAEKRNGNANIRYAWYTTSHDGISSIISHGFGHSGRPENRDSYGFGIHLFPEDTSIRGAISSIVGKDGLRHLMLCRVILGNSEVVHPSSEESHPSSEQFDSGVDNLSSPRRFIVWSTHMNTHILPIYVISFRVRCLKGFQRLPEPVKNTTSPWIPFLSLVSALSKFLPPSTISLIAKFGDAYQGKKMTRPQVIQRLRQVVGDRLLIAAIKSYRGKVRHPSLMIRPIASKTKDTNEDVADA
ncbi:hypothetical protein HHK36_007410 [Tetracentron sinense]|uniref:Poly [ADP-ribose] polymerase n=1 Tax=Tetracentron sinense TaxID=13715 RepID=A0A834ZRP5_TETSI|nr:hypothetical protein HHK36_007410 [Tetracentron sinense]